MFRLGILNLVLATLNSLFWPDTFNVIASICGFLAGAFCLWQWKRGID